MGYDSNRDEGRLAGLRYSETPDSAGCQTGVSEYLNPGHPADILVHPTSSSSPPPLQRIHPDATYQGGTAKLALDHWRQQPTDAIVRSLAPGAREALCVKPDGRIMNGNTRIKVLEERGFDVNNLPREIVN